MKCCQHQQSECKAYETADFTNQINAFAIDMFGFHQDYDARLAFPLFHAIFQTVQDREYCLVTTTKEDNAFNELKYFVKLPPHPQNHFESELFILYKYSVLGSITLKICEDNDLNLTAEFLKGLSRCKIIMDDMYNCIMEYRLTQSAFSILIFCCNSLIGIFVARFV